MVWPCRCSELQRSGVFVHSVHWKPVRLVACCTHVCKHGKCVAATVATNCYNAVRTVYVHVLDPRPCRKYDCVHNSPQEYSARLTTSTTTPPFKKGRRFACYCRRPNSHVSHESSRHGLLPQLNPALRCAHHIHVHDHTIGTELTMHAARHVIHAAPVLQLRQERLASQIVELALGCCPSAMKWARWPWALTWRQATLEERQSDFVVAGW